MNIKFTALVHAVISPDEHLIIEALKDGYETGGDATHIARTELGELLVAFRPREESILILAVPSGANIVKRDWGREVVPCPTEYEVPADQIHLEQGVKAKATLQ